MKSTPLESVFTKLVLLTSLPAALTAFYLAWQADISRFLLAILLLLYGILLGIAIFHGRQQLSSRLGSLASVVEGALHGDFSLKAKPEAYGSSMRTLVDSVNMLSQSLSSEKLRAEERRVLLSKIVDQISVGVITANNQGELQNINPAALRMLNIQGREWPSELEHLPEAIRGALQSSDIASIDATRPYPGNYSAHPKQNIKRVFVQRETYREAGEVYTLILLTEIDRLLHFEQFRSWQDLVRVISHEINNSLAPIASIADTLTSMIQQSGVASAQAQPWLECTQIIAERATSLTQFIANYRDLSKLNAPQYEKACLYATLQSVVGLFPPQAIRLQGVTALPCQIDKNQIYQVLINLIKNALESMNQREGDTPAVVEVNLMREQQLEGEFARVEIRDSGCGIRNPDNLFVPFYSTKPKGSGIGLALSRQIIDLHRGSLTLVNRNPKGCIATILLPVQASEYRENNQLAS